MSSISLDLAQTVAVGPFNPHIVEPGWLIRQNVCAAEDFRGFDFVSNGEANEGIFRFADLEWQVDYSRLVVSTPGYVRGKSSRPDEKVAGVIQLLRHTPVRAIGHNFHFSCPIGEWNGDRLPQLGSESIPNREGLSPRSFRWVGTYEGDESRVELTIVNSQIDCLVIVLFNHERPTNPADFETSIRAARAFDDDLSMTRRLMRDVLHVEWDR